MIRRWKEKRKFQITKKILTTNFKEEVSLEEKTPALNIVYKQETIKEVKKIKLNIKKEYEKIYKGMREKEK